MTVSYSFVVVSTVMRDSLYNKFQFPTPIWFRINRSYGVSDWQTNVTKPRYFGC